ncbi:MAG: hypothetical protein AAF628_21715 [Planctomycetota bacterium]
MRPRLPVLGLLCATCLAAAPSPQVRGIVAGGDQAVVLDADRLAVLGRVRLPGVMFINGCAVKLRDFYGQLDVLRTDDLALVSRTALAGEARTAALAVRFTPAGDRIVMLHPDGRVALGLTTDAVCRLSLSDGSSRGSVRLSVGDGAAPRTS